MKLKNVYIVIQHRPYGYNICGVSSTELKAEELIKKCSIARNANEWDFDAIKYEMEKAAI